MSVTFEGKPVDKGNVDTLILQHISDLDTAVKYLAYQLEPAIWKEIESATQIWAEGMRWRGKYEWDKSDELWVCPPEWNPGGGDSDEDYQCWYEFNRGQGDDCSCKPELDYFDLTRLCGAGTGKLGWRWRYGAAAIGATVAKWKRFVPPYIESIRQTGFSYEDDKGCFFLPVRIEAKELARAIENKAIEDALTPLRAALDRCREAKPAFDKLIGAAKKHFNPAA